MDTTFSEICQTELMVKPWMQERTKRLPGVNPLEWKDWLIRDSAFDQQMAYRDHLISDKRNAVFYADSRVQQAGNELLSLVLSHLSVDPAYKVSKADVTRPDGVKVQTQQDHPLVALGRLVQQDFCILQEQDGVHNLDGAILCFPASWSLAEKAGRSMMEIHKPVVEYTDPLGNRVQRMFHMIRPDTPLWRANYLLYSDPRLFQPRTEDDRRNFESAKSYVRVERQSLVRLPETDAICFGIHTNVVRADTLINEEFEALIAAIEHKEPPKQVPRD